MRNDYLSKSAIGLVAALSVVGTGCSDASSAQDPAEAESTQTAPRNLLAQVNGDGFTVWYYEPEPGLIVEDEHGTASARHLPEDHDLDIIQRFELLAGKKAPPNLVQAAARTGIPTHEGEPLVERSSNAHDQARGPAFHAMANPTATMQWFAANFCVRTDRLYNWFANAVGTHWSDRVEYMKAGAWVESGTGASYKIDYNGAGSWHWRLAPSEYGSRRVSSRINRAADSEVYSMGADTSYWHCVNYHY
jgi:hypothetical protein